MRLAFGTVFLSGVIWGSLACSALAQEAKPARGARPLIRQGDLQDGQLAPDFSLKDVMGRNAVTLSALKGKPVVLIFGSCTCPPFVRTMEPLEKLHAAYKDKVHFYLVYVREAHPTDGWALPNNRFQVATPKTLAARQTLARDFAATLKVSVPILVDGLDDAVEKTYAGWPNRLFVLDAEGKIADKGTAGPRGVGNSLRQASATLDQLLTN